MRNKFAAAFFALAFFVTSSLFCEERNALLIANDKYPFGNLTNPVKEARGLRQSLEKLGFKVRLVENADIDAMEKALSDFGDLLSQKEGIGFFHYGGHAVQIGGKNYLIPSNTDISSEAQIRRLSLDLDDLMANMQGGTNIVILDACRNNPFPAATRSTATRGLALSLIKPKNSIIVFSADAGNTAQDGVFTPILTNKILEQKSLHSILTEVRREVYEKTNGNQLPKNDDGLLIDVYLAGLQEPVSQSVIVQSSEPQKSGSEKSGKAKLSAAKVDSAPPKNIWTSPDAGGTLFTADGNGRFTIDLDESLDISGYKYFEVECSSPDSKKFAILNVDTLYGIPDENGNTSKSATVQIRSAGKNVEKFQGFVYGAGRKFYDTWIKGKLAIRGAGSPSVDFLCFSAFTDQWQSVPGIKVYVKSVAVSNAPLGKVYEVDLGEFKNVELNKKEVWDSDKSAHYAAQIDLSKKLSGPFKTGDVIQFRAKGTSEKNLDTLQVTLFDIKGTAWELIGMPLESSGYKKGQDFDELWEFILFKPGSKLMLRVQSYDYTTKGPYIFTFE